MTLRDYVEQSAESHGLNPDWVWAVLKVESNLGQDMGPRFEAHLKDASYGHGQVLSSTAMWMVGKGWVDPDVSSQLLVAWSRFPEVGMKEVTRVMEEPEVAVELATAYLAYQMRRYGDIEAAVAAYNAGSVRYTDETENEFENQWHVDKWIEAMESS